MLSFIISNILICSNSLLGLNAAVPQHETTYELIKREAQTLTVASTAPLEIHREEFSVELAPAVQTTFLGSQIASQDLPASNSILVNSAMKYIGMNWDCTAVVEQGLRDLGYTVRDEAPMGFGSYGTVFYDPSQVQAGDIMMRGGHVAIYAGNGMAIHGGFGFGGVVYTDWDANPAGFSAFVRIG